MKKVSTIEYNDQFFQKNWVQVEKYYPSYFPVISAANEKENEKTSILVFHV
jgi:hypothetical protein